MTTLTNAVRNHRWWLLVNLSAIVLWLLIAREIWPRPPLEHCEFSAFDPFYWFFFVVPIFAAFAAIHLARIGVEVVKGVRTHNWSALCVVSATLVAWLGGGVIDLYEGHYDVTDECGRTQSDVVI